MRGASRQSIAETARHAAGTLGCRPRHEVQKCVCGTQPQNRDEGEMAVSANVKKGATWLVIAFALFFLFTQPERSADLVLAAVALLRDAANAIVTFFESLV